MASHSSLSIPPPLPSSPSGGPQGSRQGPLLQKIAFIPPSCCIPDAKASGKFCRIPGIGILINAKRKFVFVVIVFFPKDQGSREGNFTQARPLQGQGEHNKNAGVSIIFAARRLNQLLRNVLPVNTLH